MAANIPSVHVPAVCAASAKHDTKPYKNAYDLGAAAAAEAAEARQEQVNETSRIPPSPPPKKVGDRRRRVDAALPLPADCNPSDVYFGALEVNGTGVRFYGDFCLILTEDALPADSPILDRNSYDLIRSPIYERLQSGRALSVSKRLNREIPTNTKASAMDIDARMAEAAVRMAGRWKEDGFKVAAIKVLDAYGGGTRRLSTGQIADAILDDEDYIEVLKHGSFGTRELQEVRIAGTDVAADVRIAERFRFGPPPSATASLWRDRRRAAEKALAHAGASLRVVTSRGRVK